jgi:hypothetical protein
MGYLNSRFRTRFFWRGHTLPPYAAVFFLAGVLGAGVACGASSLPSGDESQAADTAVRAVGSPRYAGVASLVEELTIGVENGAAEYMFTSVQAILPLRDGTLLILDVSSGRGGGSTFLRQFDATGKYIRTFGRTGRGPGEYTRPHGLTQLPDGRVVLLDAGKMNVYSAEGQFLEQWSFANRAFAIAPMPSILADTAGYVYLGMRASMLAMGGSPLDAPVSYERWFNGRIVDTISAPRFPDGTVLERTDFTAFESPGSSVAMLLPYWPEPSWTLSPMGYVISGVPSRYAIDLRIPNVTAGGSPAAAHVGPPVWREGDRVVSIRRQVPQLPVSDAERNAHRNRITNTLREAQSDWSWKGPDVPRVKPAYNLLKAALDGRIWVQIALPSVPKVPRPADPPDCPECAALFGAAVVMDVFEPDGAYVGQVSFESASTQYLSVMRGDVVWGVVFGPNDVPSVKRWRVSWQ